MTSSAEENKKNAKLPSISNVASEAFIGAIGAGIALEGSVLAVLLGATAVPIMSAVAKHVIERRSESFKSEMENAGLINEEIVSKSQSSADFHFLFNSSVSAAMNTDLREKHALLARSLKDGLESESDIDIAIQSRLVQVLARVDKPEIALLGLIDRLFEPTKPGVTRSKIISEIPALTNSMEALICPLVADGVLLETSVGGETSFKMSSFGSRLIALLSNK